MTVHRRILKKDKLVYLLVGLRSHKYEHGRSRILYIGTTKKGAHRIAASVAHRAEDILEKRGVRLMEVYITTCTAVPGFESWRFLEKALIAAFQLRYYELPDCNEHGSRWRWNERFEKRIKLRALNKILDRFE